MLGSETRRVLKDCQTFLGKGGFGAVTRLCARDGEDPSGCSADACIAVKYQRMSSNARREVMILEALSGVPEIAPFVPRLLGHRDLDSASMVMYMEVLRAPFATLMDFILTASRPMVEAWLPDLVRQVMQGLVRIQRHFPNLRHNDLNPKNVFLHGDNSDYAVIGDWGLAQDVASPEVARESPYVLWHYRPSWWGLFGPYAPVIVDFRDPTKPVPEDAKFEPDEKDKSYLMPFQCQYYDWHLFVYWVAQFLARRAKARREPPIPTPFLTAIYERMFNNAFVVHHPEYEDLVSYDPDAESIPDTTPFPGRLTAQMQYDIERAIAEGKLPTLEQAYADIYPGAEI